MKILHTSDWHLGQNFMGKSRAEEHEAFLFWLLEIIIEKEIEVLLVSGDIFDTGTPPNYALELYYNFLKELSSIKTLITTIITAGNHDSVSTLKAPKQLLEVLNVHGYLGTFGKNATKNFKLTLKSDTLLYEPLELIFPYKDTLSTPKTISSSIS